MSESKQLEMPNRYYSLINKKFQLETRLEVLKKKHLEKTKDYDKILEEIEEVKEDIAAYL